MFSNLSRRLNSLTAIILASGALVSAADPLPANSAHRPLPSPRPGTWVEFYVSPVGNDNWSGTLPDPSSNHVDGPFATIEKARDAVRELNRGRAAIRVRWFTSGAGRIDGRTRSNSMPRTAARPTVPSSTAPAPMKWLIFAADKR